MNSRSVTIVASLAGLVVFGIWIWTSNFDKTVHSANVQSPPLGNVLQESAENEFEQALDVRRFEFPRDHGPHLGFQTEWWYFTGNLTSRENERFGFQFTIFRRSTAREKPQLDSDWATNQTYLAHVALTDLQTQEYLFDERYSRGALDLAGAQIEPFSVWVENWSVTGSEGECEGCLNLRITAQSESFSFDLELISLKPVVFQGDLGLSRKGEAKGSASYYYSLTRLKTTGSVSVSGETKHVSGESWMDHEWFSSILGENEVGWDWFALQLDDYRELMFFQIRRRDPVAQPIQYGIMIDERGSAQPIAPQSIRFTPQRWWTSISGESQYPVQWQIEVPQLDLMLNVEAALDAQERSDSFRYWEGAVVVSGTEDDRQLSGKGYLEMTAY